MRRVLLDTNVLLWWLAGNSQLGTETRRTVADAETEVFVSAATIWEISIKLELGKLKAPKNMEREVEREGFSKLAITLSHGEVAGSLPKIHRDPFDRMLVFGEDWISRDEFQILQLGLSRSANPRH
jgi:PIN domain nuclease of toxin-antitoxin system